MIESLQFKNRAKGKALTRNNYALAEAYKSLGNWEQWKHYFVEAFESEESDLGKFPKAKRLSELAQIEEQRQ